MIFQSTRPVRAATRHRGRTAAAGNDFNPRGPCGPRRPIGFIFSAGKIFQSTRPVRAATSPGYLSVSAAIFQSTRPVRAATKRLCLWVHFCFISIHAARAGRDYRGSWESRASK